MLDSCVAAAPDDGADVPIQMDALQFIQKKKQFEYGYEFSFVAINSVSVQ